jgi:hypothetical protein
VRTAPGAALVFFARAPLDVLQIQTEPGTFALWLLGYYIVVGLPFLLAGFAIGVPFAAYPERMGRLYFWDLLGAAAGSLLAVSLMEWQGVPVIGPAIMSPVSELAFWADWRRDEAEAIF